MKIREQPSRGFLKTLRKKLLSLEFNESVKKQLTHN